MSPQLDLALIRQMTVGIGDAARITGVPIRQIRYWEEKGIVTSRTGAKINKKYDYYALKKIQLVASFMQEGFTLDAAADKAEARMDKVSQALDDEEKSLE